MSETSRTQRVGYVRVSSPQQNPSRQLTGVKLDKLFMEYASGKSMERPELQKCLQYLREGDTLIVHSLDRLARNVIDLRKIVSELTDREVTVEFLTEKMVFTKQGNPLGELFLHVLGAVVEFERKLSAERQAEGIELARAAGKYKGRKPSMNSERSKQARILLEKGVNKARVARSVGVARQTLYKWLDSSKTTTTLS